MLEWRQMLGDSKQLFRVLKTALAALLVFITLVLFALHQMASDNREHAPTEPASPVSQAETPGNTEALFERIQPAGSAKEAPFSVPQRAEPDHPQSNSLASASLSEGTTIIKQRGHAAQQGSRYIKIGFNGEELGADANEWSCARDLESGLLWEVKLFNAGISDAEHTYSWYDPLREQPGQAAGGTCFGVTCDTQAYIDEMNRLQLCATDTWRLPTFTELDGLIDRNYYNPTINQEIFPHARGAVYWTSTELKNNPEMVMQIDFFNGMSTAVRKDLSFALRLVSP